jgi:hypothetical protein
LSAVPDIAAERALEASTDDSCSEGIPVWNTTSLSFTLTLMGGLPGPDAGCTSGNGVSFDFSLPEATLAEIGCSLSGHVDSVVHLSQADVAAVLASVGAIRTTCARSCGNDLPTMKLTVSSSGSGTTYTSNFYAGCARSTDKPPFVPVDSLIDLDTVLHDTFARACAADAGVRDAGGCMNR